MPIQFLRQFRYPLTCILLMGFLVTPSMAQDILMQNGRLIIGDGTVIENGSLLISDGVIKSISRSTIAADAGTTIVDLSGKTVMPALIDAHAHLGYQSSAGWGAQYYDTQNLEDNLAQYAYYGFSAVLSAGSDPVDLALAIQTAQESGQIGGARLLFAVGVGPHGQGPNDRFLDEVFKVENATQQSILRGVSTPLEAIAVAREVSARNIPFIKIWVDSRGGSQEKLSSDAYKPLIAEAQRLRVKTLVHQESAQDMLAQIEAGAAGFLHGRLEQNFDRNIARQAARSRTFIVPNLGLAELRSQTIAQDPFLQPVLSTTLIDALSERQTSGISAAQIEREETLKTSFGLLVEEGVDILLGTDAGAIPNHPFGYTGHKELEIYVRLGLTEMQALLAATSQAASHLGLDKLGSLVENYSADLVILSANPLDSIRNTQSIEQVYLRGQLVDRDTISTRLKNREQAQ